MKLKKEALFPSRKAHEELPASIDNPGQENQSMTKCYSFYPAPEEAETTFPALVVPHFSILARTKHGPD